jgi:hypothetical protein
VEFFRIGGPSKAAQIPEESQENKVSAGTQPDRGFRHQMLEKTLLSKKAHKKSLTTIEQSLMAGPNCQAGQGNDGAAPSWASSDFYRRGG